MISQNVLYLRQSFILRLIREHGCAYLDLEQTEPRYVIRGLL